MDENMNPVPNPEPAHNPPPPVQPRQPYTYTPPPRITFPMERQEFIFAQLTLLSSFVLCNSLIYAGANLGFAAGFFGTVLSAAVYLHSRGHKFNRYSAAILVLCLVTMAAYPRTDDAVMKVLVTLGLFTLPSLALCLAACRSRYDSSGILSLLDGPITLFGLGFGRMAEAGRGIKDAFRSTGRLGKVTGSVLLGLLISIPVLLILVPLLMAADAAFEGLLDLLPEFQWQETVVTLVTGGFLGFVLYTRGAALHRMKKPAEGAKPKKGLSAITVNTVLIAAAFVYTVYLFSQLAYFVGGFSGILPEGYTLALYARRGFFEMSSLCAINLSLISFSVALISAEGKVKLPTKLLCLFLGIVTLFLVATASAKMLMYIHSYGLTRLRVLTEVFMIWLAISTVIVCIWLFRPGLSYMKPILLLALLFCAALMWADVDTVVARYNVRAYQSGKLETVDVSHLGQLSDGAVPYLYELTHDPDPDISQPARDILRLWREKGQGIRGWNYAARKASEVMAQFRLDDIGLMLELDLTGCQGEVLKNTRYTRTQPLEYAMAVKLTDVQAEALSSDLQSPYWHSLALPMQLQAILYGNTTASSYHGPFFRDEDHNILIPEISEGKFFYLDRDEDAASPESWISLHSDYDMNFTLAIWDSENNMLYFFMKDT